MKNFFKLQKIRNKKVMHHPLLAIDFEDDGKGNFVCAGVFGKVSYDTSKGYGLKRKTITVERNIEKLFLKQEECDKFLLSLNRDSTLLVFFNLNYDRVYMQNVRDDGTILEVNGRIITMKLKTGLNCIDLTNHVDGSLASWFLHLDMKKQYGIEKLSLKNLKTRVMNDVKATYYLAAFIEDFYVNEMKIPFLMTVGQQGMRLFRERFFDDCWIRESNFFNEYERNAYYGGRVEVFKRGKIKVNSYDINSTYLSIMRDNIFPDPSTVKLISNGKIYKRYLGKYQGIFRVRVKAPKRYIMVLPYKDKTKLLFPYGVFEGYYTGEELLEAIKRGYTIEKCFSFLYYRRSKPYFKDFADFVWNKRKEYKEKGNKGMDIMIKKIGNSFYGKFAQTNVLDSYFGKLSDMRKEINKDAKVQFKTDKKGEIWVRVIGKEKEPASFQFVCISCFITSFARIKLLKSMIANENSMVYCDTDCIKLLGKPKKISIGKELGQFSFEGQKSGIINFFRPKFYGDKKKGVPERAKIFKTEKDKIIYKFKRPLREKEAIIRGLKPNQWIWQTKTLLKEDDKRKWINQKESFPLFISD